jgi:putative ubiquitin-RnfH superfamily antitoxin RatB of RatAB toxin-antitoxin module
VSYLTVRVVVAEPERQTEVELTVPSGTTVAAAVEAARLTERHGSLPESYTLGVWGREVPPETLLSDGDRVELYRPLPADPKETRRALARQGRSMGGGIGMKSKSRVRRPRVLR